MSNAVALIIHKLLLFHSADVRRSISEETLSLVSIESNEESPDERELLSHHYIPDREPAPFLVDVDEVEAVSNQDVCEEQVEVIYSIQYDIPYLWN